VGGAGAGAGRGGKGQPTKPKIIAGTTFLFDKGAFSQYLVMTSLMGLLSFSQLG